MLKILSLIRTALFFCFIFCPIISHSEVVDKDICFNFYLIAKGIAENSEGSTYEKQKEIALNQLLQTQLVFDKNQVRSCPKLQFSKGTTSKLSWNESLLLSQPVDKTTDETVDAYYYRKLVLALSDIQKIRKKINEQSEIKFLSFLELRPEKVILKAEKALRDASEHRKSLSNKELSEIESIRLSIEKSIKEIIFKLDSYKQEDSASVLKAAKKRIDKYEDIDLFSKNSWAEGSLILWNDIEAQNTSVELKNLLQHFRTTENQCLDVYVVPSVKTPSRTVKEVEKNGKWTNRGGAAISSKNFPRTTAGNGHAILLTYDSRRSENKLAHEFAHLLLDKNDAHEGKKKKDLMYENSRGGSYLDEIECDQISENIREFFGGAKNNMQP